MIVRSPAPRQLVGLGITLAAVAGFSWYALFQIRGLERLQTEIVDRGRRDSLQLIRVQNDLSQLGLTLREMVEGSGPYGLAAYRPQFRRLRTDLEDALALEGQLAPATRTPQQQQLLWKTVERFWEDADRLLAMAERGRDAEVRKLIPTELEGHRATLSSVVTRLLVQNGEAEAAATQQIQEIYAGVKRNIYLFLAAVLITIALTGLFVIRANRRIFDRMAALSEQRRVLAGKVITVQEDTFRQLAREIHDEFGQVLTAVGMMLLRAEKKVPAEESGVKEQLREVRAIANQTLERARTMSQMLHPPVLDDYGLEKSVEWYIGQFQKQTGVVVHYEKTGQAPFIGDAVAIHVYRVLQEALNNVVRHARTQEAWVRASYYPQQLMLEIEDHGPGLPVTTSTSGMGLIGMRERAELLHGTIEFLRPPSGGARVALRVPLTQEATT